MTDLPQHLRAIAECIWNDQGDALAAGDGRACREAADRIEAQNTEIERLREAVWPIMLLPEQLPVSQIELLQWIAAAHRARSALAETRARAGQEAER